MCDCEGNVEDCMGDCGGAALIENFYLLQSNFKFLHKKIPQKFSLCRLNFEMCRQAHCLDCLFFKACLVNKDQVNTVEPCKQGSG